jgi:hypothetical protein
MIPKRFSLRTLAIFVTLVCAYFAAWDATERYGLPITPTPANKQLPELDQTVTMIYGRSCPLPLIICQWECERTCFLSAGNRQFIDTSTYHLCLWLFGPTIKLTKKFEHNELATPLREWLDAHQVQRVKIN